MFLACHKILFDPESFDPMLLMVTDDYDEAIFLINQYAGVDVQVIDKKSRNWYGPKLIIIYLSLGGSPKTLIKMFPPKKIVLDEDWGYDSFIDSFERNKI